MWVIEDRKMIVVFFFSSRRRHTRSKRDWSSDVCSSDLVCPYASKQKVIEKAESGWWPTDRQRPRGMARPRFRSIVAALRDGKHMNGKQVYHGREQFQAKLPPPRAKPLPPPVPPPASDRPETAAEEF